MTLAIEPMVNMGSAEVMMDPDGWTVRTRDRKPSAHFEHTVAVGEDGPIVLTGLPSEGSV
jgi:methionyl aminopeptidase